MKLYMIDCFSKSFSEYIIVRINMFFFYILIYFSITQLMKLRFINQIIFLFI